jgi:hypothetical protein
MSSRSRIKVSQSKRPAHGACRSSEAAPISYDFVEAPDAKAAELAAVKQFELDEWKRKRLLVRERV